MSCVTRRHMLRGLSSMPISSALTKLPFGSRGVQPMIDAPVPSNVRAARTRILEACARSEATGVAVAVVHRGAIVWEEGFGWANRDARVQATSNTPFTLASITKPFTATTLMTLAAEGKLALDAPANHFLRDNKIRIGALKEKEASIRQLGAHASGLPTMYEGYSHDEASFALSPDALLKNYGTLAYPPQTCYEYSNIGFSALAEIASNLTQFDFGTLLTHRVLNPLRLRNSFFGARTTPQGAAARYDPSDKEIPFYTTSTPASGELYASAHDLAIFAMFNLKHANAGNRVLDHQWIDELHKPVFTGPSGVATTFGWFRASLKSGAPVILKIGGQPGVATALYMLPSEDLACLVLTNRSDGRELCNDVCNYILSSYVSEWQQPEETCGPSPSSFVLAPHFQGRWKGKIVNDGANMPVTIDLNSSSSAELTIAKQPTMRMGGMRGEGPALTGVVAGRLDTPDAIRTSANLLKIKLLPHSGGLVGRILATGGDPNVKNVMLPFVIDLFRS